VVANSNIAVQDRQLRDFELKCERHLAPLISTLSGLASVRGSTRRPRHHRRLRPGAGAAGRPRGERASLLKQLAAAATTASETSLQQKLDASRAHRGGASRDRRAAHRGAHGRALRRRRARASTKHSAVGPLGTAFNRALHALEEILAIA